ncbi:MAG: cytochrome c-type biogenesis protein CcmH [Anaerolineales bacterium]
MKRFPWILMIVVLMLSGWVGTVYAQQPTPSDDDVNKIASQLFCPVCENTPLDVCPTQACAQWRDEIRLRLAQGWSEDQIKEYFAESYGIRVLAEPPRQGLNWLVYIVPPVAFIAGAYILFRAFRSWQALSKQVEVEEDMLGDDSDTDPYLERLEEELKKRG